MKTTVVPAQITTVEDKVVGNLTLGQLMLLVTPLFLSGALYAATPPAFEIVTYKVVIITFLFCLFSLLSFRINEKLFIVWMVIFARFYSRPRYYVFDKNDSYLRQSVLHTEMKPPATSLHIKENKTVDLPVIDISEHRRYEDLLQKNNTHVSLKTTRKGKLHVTISQIK